MKNKPLEKIHNHGCLCCPSAKLKLTDKDIFCRNGFGDLKLKVKLNTGEEKEIDLWQRTPDNTYFKFISIGAINKFFKELFAKCEWIELFENSPLHDETYEYNNGEWLLIKQGMGFA